MKLLSSHQYNSLKIYIIHIEDRNLALIQLYWMFDSEKTGDNYGTRASLKKYGNYRTIGIQNLGHPQQLHSPVFHLRPFI